MKALLWLTAAKMIILIVNLDFKNKLTVHRNCTLNNQCQYYYAYLVEVTRMCLPAMPE